MIPGEKIELTVVKRATHFDENNEPDRFVEEFHLFPTPNSYCKHTDGIWVVQAPAAQVPVRLVSPRYKVTEHEDGTITVEGPPFKSSQGLWKMVKGNWEEVIVG